MARRRMKTHSRWRRLRPFDGDDVKTGPDALSPGRHAWLQVLSGKVDLHGEQLSAGDGAAISDESELRIVAQSTTEIMLFDLA